MSSGRGCVEQPEKQIEKHAVMTIRDRSNMTLYLSIYGIIKRQQIAKLRKAQQAPHRER
jgi:hypothetical protein